MARFFCLLMIFSCQAMLVSAQFSLKGFIVDNQTNEPLAGVNITDRSRNVHAVTDWKGTFTLSSDKKIDSICLSVSGYEARTIPVRSASMQIGLSASFTNMNEVVVSANREAQRKADAPAAIQVVSKTMINDTRATRLDMLVNKVPGVFMVDLGNEQHSMSMRQPLGYSNLFLYLQDGIPIRTIGDFNHNALIEINQASLEKIEVIKGPASSLYGSEAVGGVINFITQSPSQLPAAKVQAEAGSPGYTRADFFVSNTVKKLGLYLGGYYANQHQDEKLHNDFHKAALTFRADYHFSDKTRLVTTADYINYSTDQKGGLDSARFYAKDYTSSFRFTYRKVNAIRIKSALTKTWNENNKTGFHLFYRNSAIAQNPFYSISNITNDPRKAKGQVNEDAFQSYGTVIQHTRQFNFLKARWISGLSADISPATYNAKFISIDKDNSGIFHNYSPTDSLLTNYNVDLLNTAIYMQFELTPVERLKIVAAARYDRMDYSFDNHLPPSAFSGAPDAKNGFSHFTPKAGLTYDLNKNRGVYANYSVGFAPPNISDLYRGVKVPELKPSSYINYEVGGWFAFNDLKGYAEISLYQMNGKNEIVNVRLNDGTYQNQNTGATRHRGMEASLKYIPLKSTMLRVSGTIAEHRYIDYVYQGKTFSGNTMSQAPGYIFNTELTFKPAFIKGLRLAVECQSLGNYFTDAENTRKYKGFTTLNARLGYAWKGLEAWTNCINFTNAVYATTVETSNFGTTYRPGQLRTIHTGISYYFNKKS